MMRAFSPAELLILQENTLDSDRDMSVLLCRSVSEIRSQRAAMGLLSGKALDVARKEQEAR
jgi:hypothetical protein